MLDPKEINRLLLRIAKEDEKALEELYDKNIWINGKYSKRG